MKNIKSQIDDKYNIKACDNMHDSDKINAPFFKNFRSSLTNRIHNLSSHNTWAAKFIRFFSAIFFPVDSDRTGNCNNCGDCCKLPKPCPALAYKDDGKSYCSIYKYYRPPTCKKYPRTRYEHLTLGERCGYSFKEK